MCHVMSAPKKSDNVGWKDTKWYKKPNFFLLLELQVHDLNLQLWVNYTSQLQSEASARL